MDVTTEATAPKRLVPASIVSTHLAVSCHTVALVRERLWRNESRLRMGFPPALMAVVAPAAIAEHAEHSTGP